MAVHSGLDHKYILNMLQEAFSVPDWKRMGLEISEHVWVLLTPILGFTFIRTLEKAVKKCIEHCARECGNPKQQKCVYRPERSGLCFGHKTTVCRAFGV